MNKWHWFKGHPWAKRIPGTQKDRHPHQFGAPTPVLFDTNPHAPWSNPPLYLGLLGMEMGLSGMLDNHQDSQENRDTWHNNMFFFLVLPSFFGGAFKGQSCGVAFETSPASSEAHSPGRKPSSRPARGREASAERGVAPQLLSCGFHFHALHWVVFSHPVPWPFGLSEFKPRKGSHF